MPKKKKKKILIAVLNWGLGHAARCIPLIQALQRENFSIVIASDGAALALLKKEFPELESAELPSYQISYPVNPRHFRREMILKLPRFRRIIRKEKKWLKTLVEKEEIHAVISDGRLGMRNKKIKSFYITHQVNLKTGKTSRISGFLHRFYIRKFDRCLIPDFEEKEKSLAGSLSHPKTPDPFYFFLGPLSRMKKEKQKKRYDILILISGPEPQRSLLEKILLEQFLNTDKKILMVRGVVEEKQVFEKSGTVRIVNFMKSKELETALNQSDLVISRSGYSTVMDLYSLGKKAFFIPTPGQFEQEYLARRLDRMKIIPSCSQDDFSPEQLKRTAACSGFKNGGQSGRFSLFSSVKENSDPILSWLST